MSGTLAVTDALCERSQTLQLWNILQPDLKLDATENGPLFAALLQSDLARPYAVRIDSAGRVLSVAHDPAAGEFGVSFMRRLISSMEIVSPPSTSVLATSWHIDEPDVAGERTSSYTVQPWIADRFGAATAVVHRTTGVEIDPPDQGRFVHRSETNGVGDDDIRWLASGELQSLNHSYVETTRVTNRVVSRVAEVLRVDRVLAPRIDPNLDEATSTYAHNLLASANAAPLHVADTERAVHLRAYTQSLGKDTVATLTRAVENAPGHTTVQERTRIAGKVEALFYVRPASIDAFLPRAERASSDSTKFLVTLQALGGVGIPQAQTAMLSLLAAHHDDVSGATNIVTDLGLVERPIPQIDPVLEQFSDGSSSAARAAELALGTLAQSVAKSDAKRERRLVARFEHRLRTRVANRRRLELFALGNASDASSLDVIERYVTDPDASVRVGAAMALRHQPSSVADDTLRSMLSDERSTVRIAASSAFAERVPGDESYATLRAVARNDRNATVRSTATDAIWKTRDTRGDARTFVTEVARTDTDESVRKFAQADLASDDSQDDEDPNLRQPMDYVLTASR